MAGWFAAASLILFLLTAGVPQALLRKEAPWAERLTVGCAVAMLVFYSMLLVSSRWETLPALLVIPGVAGAIGWYLARQGLSLQGGAVAAALLLFIPGFVKVMFDPLWAHDARSVWFFHARILYFANGWGDPTIWRVPDAALFHFDYPKLVASLSAGVSLAAGLWNELLPKAPLLALWTLLIGGVWSLPWNHLGRWFLGLSILGAAGSFLWTGYMDGYFAALMALGLLHATEKRWALAAALLSVAMNLKAEGGILAVALGSALVAALAVKILKMRKGEAPWRMAWAFLGLVPLALWAWRKAQLGLVSEFSLDAAALARATERILQGSLFLEVAKGVIHESFVPRALLLVGGVFFWRKWTRAGSWSMPTPLYWIVVGAHTLGVVAVYAITPWDMAWHISQSVGRVFLPLALALMGWVASVLGKDRPEG